MALDEPQTNDVTFVDQGITFVIEKGLLEEAQPISIEFIESLNGSGFNLKSSLPSGTCC